MELKVDVVMKVDTARFCTTFSSVTRTEHMEVSHFKGVKVTVAHLLEASPSLAKSTFLFRLHSVAPVAP